MAYEKTNWVDNETPINAANLNKMEDGIVEASKTGGVLDGTIVEWEEDEIPEGYEEVESDIVNSTEITDKENKTYSANVIDGLVAPQMLTVILSANQTTTSTAEKVKLDKVYGSCGDKLTISNNEVVIGENINVVEISANVHLLYNSPAGGIAIKVTKNDSEIVAMSSNKPNNKQGAQIVITPIIIRVKKGDKIAISYTGGTGHGLTSCRTYMTVKKIK